MDVIFAAFNPLKIHSIIDLLHVRYAVNHYITVKIFPVLKRHQGYRKYFPYGNTVTLSLGGLVVSFDMCLFVLPTNLFPSLEVYPPDQLTGDTLIDQTVTHFERN
jgi:hypothetical protein